jgi:RHS repeat-associated protein
MNTYSNFIVLFCTLLGSLQATTIQITSLEAFLHSAANPVAQATFNSLSPEFTSSLDANNLGSFTFAYTNNTGAVISNASWTLFIDLDIDRDENTYFNEYGDFISFLRPFGAPSNSIPFASWEIDEPGYLFGDIYNNSLAASLDNSNAIPTSGFPDDVSQALFFQVVQLAIGQTFSVTGTISLTDAAGLLQYDPNSQTSLYINGYATLSETTQSEVPEPATAALVAIALTILYRRSNKRYLLSLLPFGMLLGQSAPDLRSTAITASINTDPQTLATTGSLSVTVLNAGTAAASPGFQLTAFEDRNNNGRYDVLLDNRLGTANIAASLSINSSTTTNIPISGSLLFPGNIIYVLVDANNVILESDENNNLRHTGQNSIFTPPAATALNPTVKWVAESFTEAPTSRSSLSTPTVGDVNGDGIPDVVFSTYIAANRGILRVVSGNTGAVLFTVTDPTLEVAPQAATTLADLDSDGRPELITIDPFLRVLVFNHDGTLKWRSTQTVDGSASGIIAADLDRNGSIELVAGRNVFSSTGTRLWRGSAGRGQGYGGQIASAVADLDLDGNLEVIAGPTAYRANGTIYWNNLNTPATLLDGPVAIANFDADPNPEILIRPYGSNFVYLLEHDGSIKWSVNHPIHLTWGGQPAIGDVDGDGQPEFGIVDQANYILYETDGSIKWSLPIFETTSGVTGSVLFDLNNDGSSEVIYADQQRFYILRGSDGAILNQFPHGSTTAAEGPSVADIDRDGHADILVVADVPLSGTGPGLRAYTGLNNNWANTRPVWNQDGFTITNITDNLTVPTTTTPNWLTPGLNNFRTNGFLPNSLIQPNSAPDISVSLLRRLDANFPASTNLIARIGNGGSLPAPVHRVEFRNGLGGPLLGALNTSRILNPGEYEDLSITWLNPPSGQFNLVVNADTTNLIVEGSETNNQHAVQLIIGQGPFTTIDDLLPRAKEAGADLKWTPIPGAVSYNIYRRSTTGPANLIRSAHLTTNGSFSDQALVNNTTYFYEVRWLNSLGQESQPGTESSITPIPRTQRGDTPPSILTAPPTRGRTDLAYIYSPTAADPDPAEVLTWQIAGAPAGMTHNTTTGRLNWLPSAGQGGTYRISLTVRDSRNRTATQTFTLFIETQIVNTPPQLLSTPLSSGNVGRNYSYAVRASDADAGDVLTYLLDNGPSGMTINAATGLLQWLPTTSGAFPVIVRVRDLAGAIVTQSFTIAVQNLNRGPQITSTPSLSGNANSTFSYSPTAIDPDAGDLLSWTLLSGPTGLLLNPANGLVLWTPSASQVGVHPITIEVRDLLGATAQQSFTVSIATALNTNSPPIFISEPITAARVDQPYAYRVNAFDPESTPITYTLPTAPAGATIDAAGLISWLPQLSQVGPQNFAVRAQDVQGAITLQSFTVTVINLPPATFELISPSAGADLTRPTNVVATITDPNAGGPTITWTVKLQKPGTPEVQLASGTGPVTNATIASIDPTLLANDTYILRIDIAKGSESIFREIPYNVSGELKLGNFSTSTNDLVISFVGVPLSIARLYDSIDVRRGDFGAGWRLGAFGGVTDAPTESPLQPMRPGSKVYVNTPDGRRVSFRFDPFAPSFLFPSVVTPRFSPDAGVFDKLEVAETSVFLFDGAAYADLTNFWNPSRYILTTKAGVRYEIDEVSGLQLIRDRNGNTITFTPTAILSSTGVQITLTRDAQNRITSIREPGGAELRYSYDAAGNLTSFTDPLGLVTRYFYTNPTFPNYLTRIEDASGRPIMRNVYDTAGRITAICPPTGNLSTLAGCSTMSHNPSALTQTLFNGRGLRREYTYDERGNLLVERKYIDATNFRDTIRTYDASNNALTRRDPAGNVFSQTYDSSGNILSKVDSSGRQTIYTYNPSCQSVATITDPAGGVETFTYDSLCRLLFRRDRAGQQTEFRYDAAGNLTHFIDPRGATTIATYTPQGFPQTIRDPRGGMRTFTWTSTGDMLSKTDRNGRRIDYQYNASHQSTRESWSDGRVIQFNYDQFGSMTSASDPAAVVTYQYDSIGRLTREESTHSGQPLFSIDYGYDGSNNRTSIVDSRGGSTIASFDGLDQLSSLTQSGSGISNKRVQFEYDLAGLPIRVRRFADLTGTTPVGMTAMEYECGGCASRTSAIRHTNATGTTAWNILTFGRDAMGDVTQMTDTLGLHQYQYDSSKRLIGASHPNPALQPQESYSYDASGNRLLSHLNGAHNYIAGTNVLVSDAAFDYTFDGEGNLTLKRNRADNSTLSYQYDHRNRAIAIIARNALGIETGRNTFAYDPLNRRISMEDSTGVTRFYYDIFNPILSIDPSSVTTRRFYNGKLDGAIAEDVGGQTRWFLSDQVGTVRSISDSTGTLLTQLFLDSFGNPIQNTNPAISSQLSFVSRERIPLSGDIYFRSRLYDPRLGRFIQEDPLAPFSYSYAEASPLRFTDPLGLTAAVEYSTLAEKRANDIISVACDQLGGTFGQTLNLTLVLLGHAMGVPNNGISDLRNNAEIACAAKDIYDAIKDVKEKADYEVSPLPKP